MTTAVGTGEAIEGKVIKGHSRTPLVGRGRRKVGTRKIRVFEYQGERNVKAWVIEELSPETDKLVPESLCQEGDDLVAKKVTIWTTNTRRMREWVDHGSATHKTNWWQFSAHTAVIINYPQPAIAGAIERRGKQLTD